MSLTWVILFPLGAAIIRLFNDRFSNAMSIHRALQIGNFLLVVVALGLGTAASGENGTVSRLTLLHFLYYPPYLARVRPGSESLFKHFGRVAAFRSLPCRSAYRSWLMRCLILAFHEQPSIFGRGPRWAPPCSRSSRCASPLAICENRKAQHLVPRSYMAGTISHHPGNHQWRDGIGTCQSLCWA